MRWQLLLVPSVVLLLGADDTKKDAEKLQGTWALVAAEREGRKAPEEFLKTAKVVIKDDTLVIQVDKPIEKVTFKLDPTKKPKWIDLTEERDGKEGTPRPGIYELDGDSLKLCWRKPGSERPTEFVTKPESNLHMFVLKREKQE